MILCRIFQDFITDITFHKIETETFYTARCKKDRKRQNLRLG